MWKDIITDEPVELVTSLDKIADEQAKRPEAQLIAEAAEADELLSVEELEG